MSLEPEHKIAPSIVERIHPETLKTSMGALATLFIVDTAYTLNYDMGTYPLTRYVARCVGNFIWY